MSEVRNSIGRRTFLARFGALVLPAAALLALGDSAEAKKMTVLGKSAYATKTAKKPKATKTVRHTVHTAHGFGKSSR